MSSRFLCALAAVALAGCDREGTDLLPDNSKFPSVVTIGELHLDLAGARVDFKNSIH